MAVEEIDILIVGGGICGLATALALHRKGIKSVVLERSNTLRATGSAISVFPNGWRALHQLGLDSSLRSTAVAIQSAVDVQAETGVERRFLLCDGEARCIRRNDLIEAIVNALPLETIRFGCQVVTMNIERSSSYAVLQLHDGSLIRAKVLIGCDGANSVIANYIGLKPTRLLSTCSIRGLTIYPNGHRYAPEFLRIRIDKHLVGRLPIDDKTVYWFVALHGVQKDTEIPKDPASIRQLTLSITTGLAKDIVEMIENTDLSSLSFTRLRYRAPWNLLSGNLRRETVTVAGDAWHVMGPFLGQGGSAALEDAVVLARCLSKKISIADLNGSIMHLSARKAMEAMDDYLKERRQRVALLSTQTYVTDVCCRNIKAYNLSFTPSKDGHCQEPCQKQVDFGFIQSKILMKIQRDAFSGLLLHRRNANVCR